MANPYHDAEGQFTDAGGMQTAIMSLHQKGDVAGAMKLHQEWMEATASKNLHEKALGAEKEEILTNKMYEMVGRGIGGHRMQFFGNNIPKPDKEELAAFIRETGSTKLLQAAIERDSVVSAEDKLSLVEEFNQPQLAGIVALGDDKYLKTPEGKERLRNAFEAIKERFPDDTDSQNKVLVRLAQDASTEAEVDYVIDNFPYEDRRASALIEFAHPGIRAVRKDVAALTPEQSYRMLKNIHERTPDTQDFASKFSSMYDLWDKENGNEARYGRVNSESDVPVGVHPKPEDLEFLKKYGRSASTGAVAGVQRRVDATMSGWAQLQQDVAAGKVHARRITEARIYMGEAQILQRLKPAL